MNTSAARQASVVLGPLALLAALGLSGLAAPASTVDSSLVDQSTSSQKITAANWSVIVNGSTGSKTIQVTQNTVGTFTLTNNGTVNLRAMTVTVSSTKSVDVCTSVVADCTSANRAGTIPPSGGTTSIVTEAPAVGATQTWQVDKNKNGINRDITISVSVSSADIIPG